MTDRLPNFADVMESIGLKKALIQTDEERRAAQAQLEIDQIEHQRTGRRTAAAHLSANLRRHYDRQALHAAGLPYTDDDGDIVIPPGES